LSETLETCQRPRRDVAIESPFFIETRTEAHAFAQTIDDRELPVDVTGDDHMETIRTQIDRGQ